MPGKGATWVVAVHGRNGRRKAELKILPVVHRLALPFLDISYRNDEGAPPSPDGLLHLGDLEWRDLEAALRQAQSMGARRFVLYGTSMGGQVIGQFLGRSPAGLVGQVIMDAPMIDVRTTAAPRPAAPSADPHRPRRRASDPGGAGSGRRGQASGVADPVRAVRAGRAHGGVERGPPALRPARQPLPVAGRPLTRPPAALSRLSPLPDLSAAPCNESAAPASGEPRKQGGQEMAVPNGVIGIDEPALVRYIELADRCAHDQLFHGKFHVEDLHLGFLTDIAYEFAEPPSVSFSEATLGAVLQIRADQVAVALHYSGGRDPTALKAAFRAGLALAVDPDGIVSPRLERLTIGVSDEPALSEILDKALAPYLADLIRTSVLKPIKIPPVGHGHFWISPPALASGMGRLLVTTAVAPKSAGPAPLDEEWPEGRLFAGADLELLGKLVDELVPLIDPVSGTWSRTVRLLIGQITLKAAYEGKVTGITLGLVPGHTGEIRGTITTEVRARLRAKNLGSWSASGSLTGTVRGRAEVSAANELRARLTGVEGFSAKLDFGNTPRWLDRSLSEFVGAFPTMLSDALSAVLSKRQPLTIGRIPTFVFSAGGRRLVVGVKNAGLTERRTADGGSLLTISGEPDVRLLAPPE
ncbi:hypothetical protein MF672_031605 [Actinomadura sp. ATCC 31491]|uniref:Alpha/beta fold hydrolase n=1 Tax=Actinomadura luzonensis TaxID=2805427 RepID=A0ABT0G109_9ACTN|nr:hypothetical protein [Actinomadura luzonensis]MCK2218304.1 hypothetical protein [Actinomadura luzonensis]